MFRQAAFLAILAGVGGCYVDDDRVAQSKFQVGGEEGQDEIETLYVASVSTAFDGYAREDGSVRGYVDDSQTIFLTRLDYNYATGEASVKLKTVDKHGNVSSACDGLYLTKEAANLYNHRSTKPEADGDLAAGLEDNPSDDTSLHASIEFTHDPENGSQISFDMMGWAKFRGRHVSYHIDDSTVRVSEGVARIVGGKRLEARSMHSSQFSHAKGGSQAHRNYMEAIQAISGHQARGYGASTGLLTESYLMNDNHLRQSGNPGVPKLDSIEFWEDAFSNCGSSPSSGPTSNN